MGVDAERLSRYLTEADLAFLVETLATQHRDKQRVLETIRDKPDILALMLKEEALFKRLQDDREMLFRISPYLLFSILLRRALADMDQRTYTLEPAGYRQQVPVFDVAKARRLLNDEELSSYLTEFFVSFTRIGGTTVVFRRGDRLYRRRFSDFDMDDLIRLCGLLDEEKKFGLYRRLGDLALFLSGVFADHIYAPAQGRRPAAPGRGLDDFDEEGRRYYQLASQHENAVRIGLDGVLGHLSERFDVARRVVGYVADRYTDLGGGPFLLPDGR